MYIYFPAGVSKGGTGGRVSQQRVIIAKRGEGHHSGCHLSEKGQLHTWEDVEAIGR